MCMYIYIYIHIYLTNTQKYHDQFEKAAWMLEVSGTLKCNGNLFQNGKGLQFRDDMYTYMYIYNYVYIYI